MVQKRKTEAQWLEASSRWACKTQVNGKRKTFYSSAPGRRGKAECERKADAWIDAGATDDPRVQTVWAAFLEDIKKTTGTGNYINHEKFGRLWILPKLTVKRLSAVTLQDWQDVLTEMYVAGKSKKYMQDTRGAMTAFYQYCRRNRLRIERPDALRIPKDAPEGEHKIIQPDKLKTLFNVDWVTRYGNKEQCFFIHAWRFMVLTGIRRGELCGLRWEDREGIALHIRRAFNSLGEETKGKTKKAQRYLVLNQMMKNALTAQEANLRARGIISPWVFPDEEGGRLDGNHLYKKWVPYRKQNEIGATLHGLRHTLISISKSDLPSELLKSVVGHTQAMDTYGVYGHPVDGEAVRASEILEAIFGRLLQ